MITMRSVVLVLVVSLASSGCTSYKRIMPQQSPTPTPGLSNVKRGDTVRVSLRDGTRHVFTVESVSDVGITSRADGHLFLASEIVGIERRHYSAPKNIGLVLLGVTVTFLVALAAAYAQVVGGWS
jgi:hypothetical protein